MCKSIPLKFRKGIAEKHDRTKSIWRISLSRRLSEIQVLVETRQSMDADKEVPEEKEKDLMSVGTAMTAT